MTEVNWRIQQMIQQMGGMGLNGAFTYTGARRITYKAREDDGKPGDSVWDDKSGTLSYDYGIMFTPNLNINARMIVTVEYSDTYTIRLLKVHQLRTAVKTGQQAQVLAVCTDVYDDMLQDCVERMYDEWVREHQDNWIRI